MCTVCVWGGEEEGGGILLGDDTLRELTVCALVSLTVCSGLVFAALLEIYVIRRGLSELHKVVMSSR